MNIKKYKHEFQFLIFIIIIFLLWHLGRFIHIDIQGMNDALVKFPKFYSGILFVLLYVIITFFVWFSKDIFWIVGAVLFGAILSTLYVWIAEILNAFILFYMSRFLGRNFVQRYAKGKYDKFDKKIGRLSFSWFFMLRVIPLIPYRFLDIGAGLTCISSKRYMTAVILGTPIKTFWIQYIIAGVGVNILKDPYAITEYFLSNKILLGISFIYSILVILLVIRFKIKLKD